MSQTYLRSRNRCSSQPKPTDYLFQLSEEVPLECRVLHLLLPGESCELSAALRFDVHATENTFTNATKDYIQRPG